MTRLQQFVNEMSGDVDYGHRTIKGQAERIEFVQIYLLRATYALPDGEYDAHVTDVVGGSRSL